MSSGFSFRERVDVVTGARLHLGLLDTVSPFGGVGLMVTGPPTWVRAEPAEHFVSEGGDAQRIRDVAARLARRIGLEELPPCRLTVLGRPDPHTGLGSGTQLALAVAAALVHPLRQAEASAQELIRVIAHRGHRSQIGTHGFFAGGLLYETGEADMDRRGTEPQGLQQRVALPSSWRVVLLRAAADPAAVAGEEEQRRFDRLPPARSEERARLRHLIEAEIIPAAQAADFDRFSEAVYRYNRLSGSLFAAAQGGPYHGVAVEQRIAGLRAGGCRGVGQSSWGPTVFAFCRSVQEARRLSLAPPCHGAQPRIVRPRNRGRRLTWRPSSPCVPGRRSF